MGKTGWIAIGFLSVSSILLPGATKSTFCAEQPGKLAPVRIGIVSRSDLIKPSLIHFDEEEKRERVRGLPWQAQP